VNGQEQPSYLTAVSLLRKVPDVTRMKHQVEMFGDVFP
jgi:hypothetical protein